MAGVPTLFGVVLLSSFLIFTVSSKKSVRYEPTWESLDKRPLPPWYDDVKFGIFIVWGLYSVPAYGSEWFWWYLDGTKTPAYVDFMEKNYPPGFTYQDFAAQFDASMYDPNWWAEVIEASGAKYFVLTTKHHEGYDLWPTKYSWNWNSMDVGPKRDLVGELVNAVRNRSQDVHVGLYHSMFEWFNPLYLQDKANGFKTQDFVFRKTLPELYEIVNAYKPDVVWSDGDAGPDTYWNSTTFLAWLYNDSPVKDTVVANDRWGTGIGCHHGGFYTCADRYQPGHLIKHKWENCMTIDTHSWGYRREAKLSDFLTTQQLVATLVETVSCGGNLLMNIAPTSDGIIIPIFEERLRDMGTWLKVNGEAIYGTIPWKYQKDNATSDLWYTSKKSSSGVDVYAIALSWPQTRILSLAQVAPTASTKVTILGYPKPMSWKKRPTGGIDIHIDFIASEQTICNWAWSFKLENVNAASG